MSSIGKRPGRKIRQVRYTSDFSGSDIAEIINNAIADLPVTGGKVVMDWAGEKTFSPDNNQIIITKNLLLEGLGMNNTKLKITASENKEAIKIGSAGAVLYGVGLKDFKIDRGGYGYGAISIYNVWYGKIENVYVNQFGASTILGFGIRYSGEVGIGAYYNRLINSYIRGCRRGLEILTEASGMLIEGGKIGASVDDSSYGVYIDGDPCGTNKIHRTDICDMSGANSIGLYIKKGDYNEIDARFETNTKDWQIDAGVVGTEFMGGTWMDAKTTDNGTDTLIRKAYGTGNTTGIGGESKATQPALTYEREIKIWRDTTNSKTYIIVRIGGTDYKVELI